MSERSDYRRPPVWTWQATEATRAANELANKLRDWLGGNLDSKLRERVGSLYGRARILEVELQVLHDELQREGERNG